MTKHMASKNDLATTLYHYQHYIESLIYLIQEGFAETEAMLKWLVPDSTQKILEGITYKEKWRVVFVPQHNLTLLMLFRI